MFAALAAFPAPVRDSCAADSAAAGLGFGVLCPGVEVFGWVVDLAVRAVVGFHDCGA